MGELRFLPRLFRPREGKDDKGGGELSPEDSDYIILMALLFIFIIVGVVEYIVYLIAR